MERLDNQEQDIIEYVEKDENIPFNWYYWGPPLLQFHLTEEELAVVKEQIVKDENKENAADRLAGAVKTQEGFSDLTRQNIFNTLARYFYAYTRYSLLNHNGLVESREGELNEVCRSLQCNSMWVNHMVAGDYNPLHTHDDQMSFVLYTEVPEGLDAEIEKCYSESSRRMPPGSIEFRYGTSNIHPLRCITNRIFIPQVGDLFIFPNYLEHQVYPFVSDGVRTSLSGNLKYNILENNRHESI